MIDGAPRSATVAALRLSRLSLVSRASFDARRFRQTNVALAAASFLPVKGRIARVLVSLADAFGKDVGSGRRWYG